MVDCKHGERPEHRTQTAVAWAAELRQWSPAKVVPMSPLALFLLALASMAVLSVARVVRVHYGRTPFPDVRGRILLVAAFLIGPPILVGALTGGAGWLGGFSSLPAYLLVLIAVAVLMAIGALAANYLAPGRARPLLVLALAGVEPDPYATPVDPPLSKPLAESVAVVDAANSVFPRGGEFPAQVDRPGFRPDWDALDSATRGLEAAIAADVGIGVAVNSRASATVTDARSRLTTLRGMALARGQATQLDGFPGMAAPVEVVAVPAWLPTDSQR